MRLHRENEQMIYCLLLSSGLDVVELRNMFFVCEYFVQERSLNKNYRNSIFAFPFYATFSQIAFVNSEHLPLPPRSPVMYVPSLMVAKQAA